MSNAKTILEILKDLCNAQITEASMFRYWSERVESIDRMLEEAEIEAYHKEIHKKLGTTD